jgi:hypothetical protein
MPGPKKTINCLHCQKEFVQSRKHQKYCSSQCRFDQFLDNRETKEGRLELLERENITLRERVVELEAQLAAPPPAPKKSRAKVLTS